VTMHQFLNIKKSVRICANFWDATKKAGLFGVAGLADGRQRALTDGHEIVNMSSYSCLGLGTHPQLVQAAAEAVLAGGALNTSSSRMRIRFGALEDAEAALSDLFEAEVVTVNPCAAATWTSLPLEAQSISTVGRHGRGVVLETMGETNDRTVIITSLNKGLGASGGAIFLGRRGSQGRVDAALAQDLLRSGFFAAPIFFPIIGRSRAGLRVVLRANMSAEEIEECCGLINTRQRGPVAAGAGG
jgi:7-keto-8-aminopelargonate synthetase-like enzyme